jgi:NTP pyrophosphatase (non-canonical NTP hydrolase)
MPYVNFDLKAYRDKAETFAVYPKEVGKLYVYLGFGEVGELCNKVKKIIRGDYTLADIREDLISEFGDILWYVAMYTLEYPFGVRSAGPDNETDWFNVPVFDYTEFDGYSFFESVALLQSLLCGCYFETSEDDGAALMDIDMQGAIDEDVWRVLQLMNYCLSMLGTNIFEVSQQNIQKLEDRQSRGVLKGTGDNR